MLTRRLQVLIDDDLYERLARRAQARGTSVATLVRQAVDTVYPAVDPARRAAADQLAEADAMEVPADPRALRAELDEARTRG